MRFSGLEFTESQIMDTLATLSFVFMALIVPGYIQMHTGVSAVKLSLFVVIAYLAIHIMLEHRSEFH